MCSAADDPTQHDLAAELAESVRVCGGCGHAPHWRECRVGVTGVLGSTYRCECRRRGPQPNAPTHGPHRGRPIIRRAVDGGALILCPVGHLYHHVRKGEWGGSQWEAAAGDPTWEVTCHGTLPKRDGWAYSNANGTPLHGPCPNPACCLMSPPGGGMHDGECFADYTRPLGLYHPETTR